MTYAWIKGRLTTDVDGDNTENASGGGFDQGIAGQTIGLMNGSGHIIATTTTDANGMYQFDVHAGNYCVVFPSGLTYALKDQGVFSEDSDANPDGITDEFYIGAGQTFSNVDASVQNYVPPAPEQVCIEAEDMHCWNFHTFHGDQASGGQGVRLDHAGTRGDVWTDFNGVSGTYDLTISAQDEDDGQSVLMVKVNDVVVATVDLNRDTDGGGSNDGAFSDFVIPGLNINHGDEVRIWVDGDAGEYVRLDKLTFDPVDPTGQVGGNIWCDLDEDGLLTSTTTVTEGNNLLLDGDFEAGATHFNLGNYGAWYDAGNGSGDIIQGAAEGHDGNAADNEIFELDCGSILCQQFDVAADGTYTLTFDTYANANLNDHDNDFAVKLNGHTVQDVVVSADGSISITLDLTAGHNRIDFASGSSLNGKGPGIDNIELRQEITTTTVEPFKAGITVQLIDPATGAVIATEVTDANGDYCFENVALGDYKIMAIAPTGQTWTVQDVNANANDDIDSDVNGMGMSGVFTVAGGGDKVDVSGGLVDVPAPGSISGTYFIDANRDGLDNDGQAVAGVTVQILDGAGAVVGTAVTDANGDYTVGNLAAGTYSVKFTDTVSGQTLIAPDANGNANDDIDSDATDIGGGMSVIDGVAVVSGQDTGNNDAGVETVPGSISGRYFMDSDGDAQDNGEMGLAGIVVTLVETGATTTTGADGTYSFAGVAPGDYTVEFTDPTGVLAGKQLVAADQGDDATDSDATGDTTLSTIGGITVTAGTDTPNNDAGAEDIPIVPGSISGRYFMDSDGDAQDNGEMGLAGIVVTLVETGATTTTGADGTYSFAGVAPGDYTVEFTDPTGVLAGKQLVAADQGDDATDSDATGDTTLSTIGGITVTAGTDTPNNDAGAEDIPIVPGSISGRYFMDSDGDAQDNGEMGLAGIVVTLVETGATTTTGADGTYSFAGVAPGDYTVEFTDPTGVLAGKQLVAADQGDDATDSDATGDTTLSTIGGITVTEGTDTPNNDAGAEDIPPAPGAITGTYFCDNNSNDVQDGPDTPVVGATVELLDAAGTVVDSVTTGTDGSYTFSDVPAGDYTVKFGPSNIAGKEFVTPDAGDDAIDSDVNSGGTAPVTVTPGQTEDIDAGIKDAPVPVGSLSGRYFMDSDGDAQDNGEMGLSGIVVTLVETGATTTTGADGSYSFTGLPVGDYSVEFTDPAGVLAGKQLVTADQGDDATDSDATGDTTLSTITGISVADGVDTPNNDAGAEDIPIVPGSISGRYFMDSDGDAQDNGEMGLAGIVVTLVETGATTTTGADGTYSFAGVAPGDYTVEFTDPTGVLAGKQLVAADQGDDATDSDATGDTTLSTIGGITVTEGTDTPNNDAGAEDIPPAPGAITGTYFCDNNSNDVQDGPDTPVVGATVELLDAAGTVVDSVTTGTDGSYTFSDVPAGDYTVKFGPSNIAGKEFVTPDAGDDAIDSDVNSGGTAPVTVTPGQTEDIDAGIKDAPVPVGSLSGRYFMDSDGDAQDNGEMGLSGIVVTLVETGATTTTGADGSYSFTGLPVGDYSVEFTDPAGVLAGKQLVTADQGDDATDSDATGDTTLSTITGISVADGVDTPNNDAGAEDIPIVPGSISGRYFLDSDDDNQDNGEAGIAGVVVTLVETGATTTTAADGSYSFANLPAGDYTVEFSDPAGVLAGKQLVTANQGPDGTDSDAVGDTTLSTIGGITVTEGTDTPNNDAGAEDIPVSTTGSISGRYFMDQNNNDVDDGEMANAGVRVILKNQDTGQKTISTTDANGDYNFSNLDAGTYMVWFAPVAGKTFVNGDVGGDDTIDSDVTKVFNNGYGTTKMINLGQGEDLGDVDAGNEAPAPVAGSLSGRYFLDQNDNDQDDGEMGIAGVVVTLVETGATTTTAADGSYSFAGLPAGDYSVEFTDPSGALAGKQLVTANQGPDGTDSDAVGDTSLSSITGISVVAGSDTPNNDAGAEDVVVTPPGSLSGRYFLDSDDDNQDNGEAGIAGVVVTLVESGATTTTAADGSYSFANLPAGDYTVEFSDPAGVLAGKQLVTANQGPDGTDSDAVGDTTLSTISNIAVTSGADTPNNDAGAEDAPAPTTGSISGRYFMDQNNNDVDDGEMANAGVRVILKNQDTGQKTISTTDANGDYNFSNLDAGTYMVWFAPVAGKTFVNGDVGGDDTIDSDVTKVFNNGYGTTKMINLGQGEDLSDVDAGNEAPVVVNLDPTAGDDSGTTCADEAATVAVLVNDNDPDGGTLTVTTVNGQAIAEGDTIDVNGVDVSLTGGQLVFDGSGSSALDALNINETSVVTYTYTVSDGQGGTASADVDLTFCGTANSVADIDGSLPTSDVKFQIIDEGNPAGLSSDVWTIKLSGTGDPRLEGLVIQDAYCVAVYDPVLTGNFGTNIDNAPMNFGSISVLDDMSLIGSSITGTKPGVAADQIDNMINWILNQDFTGQGYTDAEVQGAIWGLTDDLVFVPASAGDTADAETILNLAMGQGSYQVGSGDLVGLYIDPNAATEAAGHTQPYVVAVAYDDIDCIC